MSNEASKEDERTRFERWFAFAFGGRPNGHLEEIDADIAALTEKARRIREWEAEHRAALSAWQERHSRKMNDG